MSELLRKRQCQLMSYLLDGDQAIAGHIDDCGQASRSTRLGIYANAYRQRLQETLDSDHPVLGLYLGDDLFEQMARGYIGGHPPQRPSLRHFGEQLPEFLREMEPFSRQPLIAELAAFERLLMRVFDAADADRLSLEELQCLPAEAWPQMRLNFHPSVTLFRASWNCVQVWQALRAEEPPPAAAEGEYLWLLWRNRERLTEFTSLAGAELIALCAALDGAGFSEVCERLLEIIPPDRAAGALVQLLQTWIQRGWLSGVDTSR